MTAPVSRQSAAKSTSPGPIHEIAATLAEAARRITVRGDLEATFAAVAETATTVLQPCDLASVSVRRRRRVTTVAATGPAALEIDRAQYRVGDGPCVRATTTGAVVVAEDLSRASWAVATRAPVVGVHAVLSVPLTDKDGPFGSVNIYALSRLVFSDADLSLAQAYATHAALAITGVGNECNLRAALATRQTIGQAVGLLMERGRLDPERAFHVLKRSSQDRNVKIRDLAAWLVETGQDLRPTVTSRPVPDDTRRSAPNGKPLLRIEPLADGRPGLKLTGELDLSTREDLVSAMADLEATGADLHLELGGLRFIDLNGTRLLVATADRLHRHGGTRLVLHRAPPALVQIMRLLSNTRTPHPVDPVVLPVSPGGPAPA